MVVLAAATILIRLSLLWAVPMPVPQVHDEFSYLLAADTFVHGRLTNPTHPMWEFFDTIHVNQHPTPTCQSILRRRGPCWLSECCLAIHGLAWS